MSATQMSVVVPAHNEAGVIERGLLRLLESPVVAQIVVVANGCTDDTALRARLIDDPRLVVVELAHPGKAAAVRAGLQVASTGSASLHVAVVDADVVLDAAALLDLVEVLEEDAPRIAAPRMTLSVTGCSRIMRRYLQVWQEEPHVGPLDIGGRGCYAVNRAGLARLLDLPEIMADDGWARARFAPHERVVSKGTSLVFPARTVRAQVRRRVRVMAGNAELRQILPLTERPRPLPGWVAPASRGLRARLTQTGFIGTVAWYVVEIPARLRYRHLLTTGQSISWSQDQTSRSES